MAPVPTFRSTAFGAALAALTALACVWMASALDAPVISLSELADHESSLMSCEAQGPVGGALLWCADPDSPQCIPALPQAPRPELWDRSDIALLGLPPLESPSFTWMTWPEPVLVDRPGRMPNQRLERPPRA